MYCYSEWMKTKQLFYVKWAASHPLKSTFTRSEFYRMWCLIRANIISSNNRVYEEKRLKMGVKLSTKIGNGYVQNVLKMERLRGIINGLKCGIACSSFVNEIPDILRVMEKSAEF